MKLKGKAFNRADDKHRFEGIPLIHDETELITPEKAERMLKKNKNNRPINWNAVEQFRKSMVDGEWKFHSQGIILDEKGNILTGQKRLWAIIYAGIPQYMRISRGCPSDTANLIDRGKPQTSRDLASRQTERKHSPTEQSIVRAMLAFEGRLKPTVDEIGRGLVDHNVILSIAMKKSRGIKKTKSILMIMAAICIYGENKLFKCLEFMAKKLEHELNPILVDECWNRGAAFTLAMEKAMNICKKERVQ